MEVVRAALPHPIAILTNASLIPLKEMRRDLAIFDMVVAKVDAPDEALFRRINRPFVDHTLEEMVEGIHRFRDGFEGKLVLQMMFMEANKDRAGDMARIARGLSPDEVQLNTPLRPCPVDLLTPKDMEEIEAQSAGLNVLNVYKAEKPEVVPLDESETRKRRPKECRGNPRGRPDQLANRGAEAVLTGNAGLNAFNVLQSAGVRVFIARGGTVREAVEAYKDGRLQPLSAPFGSMGYGMGRGMGCGMGMGRRMWGGYAPPTAPQPGAPSASREELSSFKGEVKALSEKLDQVLKRLDRLEKRE